MFFLTSELLPHLLPPCLLPADLLGGKYHKYGHYGCLINSFISHQGELGVGDKEEGVYKKERTLIKIEFIREGFNKKNIKSYGIFHTGGV